MHIAAAFPPVQVDKQEVQNAGNQDRSIVFLELSDGISIIGLVAFALLSDRGARRSSVETAISAWCDGSIW